MPERVRTVFEDEDDVPVTAPKVLETKQSHEPSAGKRKDQSKDHEKKKNKKRKHEESTKAPSQPAVSIIEVPEAPTPHTIDEKDAPPSTANGSTHNDRSNKKPKPKTKAFQDTRQNFAPLREKAKALYEIRKGLPIFPHGDEIRQNLRKNDVMLLVGETGSGKSTQIPQFLVDEKWCRPTKATVTQEDGSRKEITVGGCIAITQPRRVAAISLARRVAEEMGTPLGSSSPASKVGYSVRFDTSTSPSTRIKFLTEGMLLQEMLHDPWLTKYSAIVVDEVHERGVNVDLVLGFLRNLVSGKREGRGGVPLKVVVMSATADMESLMDFFQEGLQTRKATKPSEDKSTTSSASQQDSAPVTDDKISVCHIKGRQFPVKTIYAPAPVHDFVDAALKVIFQIHYKEPMPGDILVFLTGQETVEALEQLVNEYATGMDPALPKIQVLPLFAALPQVAQQRVFLPAPPRTRKIILATNIAETSVTVSGVRFVVDCGKAKVKQFRTRLGLDSLLVKPISKSAAIQRKGRAGREAPGQCYRLYTEKDYLALDETNTPEILRCDLSQALLNMKARGVDNVMGFPFLTRPPRDSLEKALLQLLSIDALEESGSISSVGRHIAKLPLTPTLGRVLLAASEHGEGCLLDVIDIISCLSVENIFLNTLSEEKKEEAEKARRDLYRREGDHLTMLATVQAYAAENSDRKAWAERHLVSHRAMQSVMDVRKQLTMQCRQAKLLPSASDSRNGPTNSIIREPSPVLILKSFLRGFSTNTARLVPDGSYRTVVGNQTVAIHPSSVLFGKKVEAIMYNEFVFTNRSYARGVSAVQMDWVGEALTGA
ncbi:putative ATP-dependent RNA helicase (Hrh1) [Aspergillus clavatus NRRL 1]|uniref:RNA helicase n=1 Tax=Aspergillus clavatus (strain ATCC 1007 / CBS 513.65 / DSM 816 / NCTC 3887 / NRRL 1 / QM 1276 / 107) TaxID=344612 RepID=A1CSY3_ASPCL|nr:ATP-dependent RNA helicase (Hrh1), putative [Aspergillus clavatus NRRL 1]EAW06420.1 ATP-dependent RNA helicase (Hrh1), putative [Aspergillus clavatus NRRL 1]